MNASTLDPKAMKKKSEVSFLPLARKFKLAAGAMSTKAVNLKPKRKRRRQEVP